MITLYELLKHQVALWYTVWIFTAWKKERYERLGIVTCIYSTYVHLELLAQGKDGIVVATSGADISFHQNISSEVESYALVHR